MTIHDGERLVRNLDKGRHPEDPAHTKHVLDVEVREHGGDQEHRIGTLRARIIDLPDVDDELLAEKRALHSHNERSCTKDKFSHWRLKKIQPLRQ